MSNSFKKAIDSANSGLRFPVMSLVRDDPGMAAVISKLVSPIEKPGYDHSGNREPVQPNVGIFKTISERTAQSTQDARTVMQILPDMELAAQILVSSILSPKDMVTTELNYTSNDSMLVPEIIAALVARTIEYFEQDYKIKQQLPKMLRDILFETGSYPIAVIPENSIDQAINGTAKITMESLAASIGSDGSVKQRGLLGPVNKPLPTESRFVPVFAMESLYDKVVDVNVDTRVLFAGEFNGIAQETYLSVTDNTDVLKIPRINEKLREQRILDTIHRGGNFAMEAYADRPKGDERVVKKLSDQKLTSLIYKERNYNYKPIAALKTQEQLNRRTVGNPLVMHLPSESVIPVYIPGRMEQQVGFFVLIDADGNPISHANNADYYQQLSAQLNSNGSFPSAMITRVKSMMGGFDRSNRDHLEYTANAYANMVEQDLLARLKNGAYGNGVALAKKEEIYRIMFARSLQKQHTQLLFIPVELMTYFAFKYTNDGVGESLMEQMKILNSLRSMTMFAEVMASLKNSIGRTEVKLKLDDQDPNPQKTIEIAMHEIIRSRQHYFPLGMNSPTDLVDWLQKAGMEFTFEGHPGIPDVSVDFGEKATNYVKPDTDLSDRLRKQGIMATGLTPDTVDGTFQADFATTIITNNILLSKRVMQIQDQFTPLLSEHMRKNMMNSEGFVNDCKEILRNNFDKLKLDTMDHDIDLDGDATKKVEDTDNEHAKERIINSFLNEYIMNFEVSLPRPNTITLETQLAALDTYTKALDATLPAQISSAFFTNETGGQISAQVDVIKEILKAYFIRQWMNDNGVMPELNALTTRGPDDKPAVDIYGIQVNHIKSLSESMTELMKALKPITEASDAVVTEIGGVGTAPAPAEGGEEGATGGTDEFGAGGSEDLGGTDELGGGEPEEVNTPEETSAEPKPGEETKKKPGEEEENKTE